jgi:3-oxoacyl-(acyl-carrier-protein) synthase
MTGHAKQAAGCCDIILGWHILQPPLFEFFYKKITSITALYYGH